MSGTQRFLVRVMAAVAIALTATGCEQAAPIPPAPPPAPPPGFPPPPPPGFPPPPPPQPPPPPPGAQHTVVVDNRLLLAITVTIPGSGPETVNGGTSRTFANPQPTSGFTVPWSLIRATTSGGQPVGDPMSGSFTVAPSTGTTQLVVDNVVGNQPYFHPMLSNSTGTPLLIMVNGGLVAENRCQCVVPAFQQNTGIEYYRLYSNSNLRGYRNGSGYTGSYVYFDNFSGFVTPGTGLINLNFTLSP